MVQLPRDEVAEKSKIYGRKDESKLTPYQKVINKAAFELCLDNPKLMNDRGELLNLSRNKVDEEGYAYKKKRSRSKAFGGGNLKQESKKIKLSSEFRQRRIKEVSEDINSLNVTLSLLEKERYKQLNMSKYGQAASVEEQLSSKRKEKRALEEGLTKLQMKESKSKRYHMGKGEKVKNKAQEKTVKEGESKSGQHSLFEIGIKPSQSNNTSKPTECTKSKNSTESTKTQMDAEVGTDKQRNETTSHEDETNSANDDDPFL